MSHPPDQPPAGRDGDVERPILGLEALERLDDGVLVIDRDWRLVFLNPAAERSLGRGRADLLGKDLWTAFPDAAGTEIERRYRRALERREPVEFVERDPQRGRSLRLRLLPSPRGLTVIYRDVTEEVEHERRVRLAQETAVVHAIDADEGATQEHSQRVAQLAAGLARGLGWGDEAQARIREAAVLHDVGKVGVGDEILLKPDRLTDEEFRDVREHPSLGARMIEGLLAAEQVAWVRHHHEWWDGTGYPDGLAGEEIPEGARILALADAFDAMTTPRPYAPGLSAADAMDEARRVAGRQFDAHLVDALTHLVDSASSRSS